MISVRTSLTAALVVGLFAGAASSQLRSHGLPDAVDNFGYPGTYSDQAGVTTVFGWDPTDPFLPAMTLATVGGGVAIGSSKECLEMMDCFGGGKADKLAEITAATLLAGEISFGAAIASGEFVQAHEQYGRNRPEGQP